MAALDWVRGYPMKTQLKQEKRLAPEPCAVDKSVHFLIYG